MHQSPAVQIIAVLCWLQLFGLVWYSLETERNIVMHIAVMCVVVAVLLSLNYINPKDRNNDPRLRR